MKLSTTTTRTRSCVRLVITESLNDNIASEKRLYRARILPYEPSMTRRDDNFIGGVLEVPREIIRPNRIRTLKGGMSVVVAIPQSSTRFERNVAAMERESQIMQKLDHKNIIGTVLPFQKEMSVSNLITTSITKCMIFDAVHPMGYDLGACKRMFQTSQLTMLPEHIHYLVSQIYAGINYIHKKRIVHRNLKPENVLVDTDFCVKIIDFGYSSSPECQLEKMSMSSAYLAPEVNDDEQPSSIDYWGIGVLVYSLYHDYSEIRTALEAARLDVDGFWKAKCFLRCGKLGTSVAESVMVLMKGLLKLNPLERWGCDMIETWLRSSRAIPEGPTTQIFPWLQDVKSVFLVTLPPEFQSTTLEDLNIAAMILRVDGIGGINLRPTKDTQLKAGFKVYFAFQVGLSDDVVIKMVNKLHAQDVLQKACRVPTNDSICDKIVHVCKQERRRASSSTICSFTALKPVFDAFNFPDFCAGAELGQDGLNLHGIFEIPVAALVREEGSVLWWPGPNDVVHQGDRGLLLHDFAEERRQTPIITLHLEKVSCLQDEKRFRRKLGLAEDEQYGWTQAACSAHVHQYRQVSPSECEVQEPCSPRKLRQVSVTPVEELPSKMLSVAGRSFFGADRIAYRRG